MPAPRIAFFPDSFHEINGVAHTARQLTAWAARQGYPFLCVRAGGASIRSLSEGSLTVLELPRGRASFALDRDLRFDLLFSRHAGRIEKALRAFGPDALHITGPSELGLLGAVMAHRLCIPLVASWHTNVHQYAASRASGALRLLPRGRRNAVAAALQEATLRASAWFYRKARLLFAPNPELCELLSRRTGRPCRLMPRGIDAELFSPARRTAPPPEHSRMWTLGYVGRLSVEKNVALLSRIAQALDSTGRRNWRFSVVGQGAEEAALRLALPRAQFHGVLRGEALATAYANMDLFVFPSHTDTFGNVVLEALASGVPALVTNTGGPAHLVRASAGAGAVARSDDEFAELAGEIMDEPDRHAAMRTRARTYAAGASWDAVFQGVWEGYRSVVAFPSGTTTGNADQV